MGFDRFLGNRHIVTVLQQMLRRGRLPHALLFTGPAGIGKFTLAVMLAQAINCEQGQEDFCERCPTCRAIGRLQDPAALLAAALSERGEHADAATVERIPLVIEAHPDVWWLPPDPVRAQNPVARPVLRMGQLRAAQRAAQLAPLRRRRVFLLEGADTMRWDYANILLKTLEEPPPTALFLLLAPSPESLLPTIRSRCFLFRFQPVATDALAAWLAEKRPQLSAAARRTVARLAQGCPGRALQLDLEQSQRQRAAVVALLELSASGEGLGAALELVEQLVKSTAERFENVLELFYSAATDLLRLCSGCKSGELRNPDLQARLEPLSRRVGRDWVVAVIASLDAMAAGLRRNIHRELHLGASVAEWMRLARQAQRDNARGTALLSKERAKRTDTATHPNKESRP